MNSFAGDGLDGAMIQPEGHRLLAEASQDDDPDQVLDM